MSEEERKAFIEAATPLIKWMCQNIHPHVTAIVTPTSAELLESSCHSGQILDHLVD